MATLKRKKKPSISMSEAKVLFGEEEAAHMRELANRAIDHASAAARDVADFLPLATHPLDETLRGQLQRRSTLGNATHFLDGKLLVPGQWVEVLVGADWWRGVFGWSGAMDSRPFVEPLIDEPLIASWMRGHVLWLEVSTRLRWAQFSRARRDLNACGGCDGRGFAEQVHTDVDGERMARLVPCDGGILRSRPCPHRIPCDACHGAGYRPALALAGRARCGRCFGIGTVVIPPRTVLARHQEAPSPAGQRRTSKKRPASTKSGR